MFCGIILKHYAYDNMSLKTKRTTKYTFHVLAKLSENFIFIYLGLALFTKTDLEYKPFFIFFTAVRKLYYGLEFGTKKNHQFNKYRYFLDICMSRTIFCYIPFIIFNECCSEISKWSRFNSTGTFYFTFLVRYAYKLCSYYSSNDFD